MKPEKLFKAICRQCLKTGISKKKLPKSMSEDEFSEAKERLETFLKNKKSECPVRISLEFITLTKPEQAEILDKLEQKFPECSFLTQTHPIEHKYILYSKSF
jgi:hypothetical protein